MRSTEIGRRERWHQYPSICCGLLGLGCACHTTRLAWFNEPDPFPRFCDSRSRGDFVQGSDRTLHHNQRVLVSDSCIFRAFNSIFPGIYLNRKGCFVLSNGKRDETSNSCE